MNEHQLVELLQTKLTEWSGWSLPAKDVENLLFTLTMEPDLLETLWKYVARERSQFAAGRE